MLSKLRQYLRTEGPAFAGELAGNAAQYAWLRYGKGQRCGRKKIHDFIMELSLTDPGIARTLWLVGDRERDQHYLLQQLVTPGNTVLDLGANVGYYVLLEASLLKGQGQIIAIEPHPDNIAQLKANVSLNNLPNVTIQHAAVAAQDGSATLHVSRLSNVHSLLPNPSYAAGQALTVPAVSLATLQEQHGPIDLIRMDIEGYEQELLDSLVALNKEAATPFSPRLLFEVHGKRYDRSRFTATLEHLHQLGYRATHLSSSDTATLRRAGLTIEREITTDGRRRAIVHDVSLTQLRDVVWTARAVVLQPDSQ